jgi:hypothetical protein
MKAGQQFVHEWCLYEHACLDVSFFFSFFNGVWHGTSEQGWLDRRSVWQGTMAVTILMMRQKTQRDGRTVPFTTCGVGNSARQTVYGDDG